MTDKVQKIRKEVARLKLCTMDEHMKFYSECAEAEYNALCKVEEIIDSLQEEPVNKDFEMALAEMIDKAQKCVVEPLVIAAQWKDELIKLAKSEEPVSESIDFEQELYKAFGQIKDFTLGIAIAKRFYDMGRKHKEPVSEELEAAAKRYATEGDEISGLYIIDEEVEAFKAGAQWKEQQMIAKAIDARCFGFQGAALFSFRLPADKYLVGSEVKVIVIKGD